MKAKKTVTPERRETRRRLKAWQDNSDRLMNFDNLVASMQRFASLIMKQHPRIEDNNGSRYPDELTHALMLRDGVTRLIELVNKGDARGAAVEAIHCERHQQTILYLMCRAPATYGYKKLMQWRGKWLEVTPNERRILEQFADETRVAMASTPARRKAVSGINKKLKSAGLAVSLHFQRDHLVLTVND